MLADILEHLLQRIHTVSAMHSMKEKGLLMLRIDGHEVETLDIILLLEVKDRIVLTDTQPADDLLLELRYLYILIVAGHVSSVW